LTYASEVYVYFPGGLGTLNEFFEIITLVQTGKIRNVPIILFGREYWTPLLSFIEKTLYEKHQAIDEKDLKLYTLVDSVDEAYDYIIANVTSC
ncbi:MAG: LOG family protein, partial [bacterium]|nr:LOG family protein [bacterium]